MVVDDQAIADFIGGVRADDPAAAIPPETLRKKLTRASARIGRQLGLVEVSHE